MRQQLLRNLFRRAQGGDGAIEIAGVPKNNGCDHQVQAGCAVLLVLIRAVADFSEPMNEYRSRQAVARLAFVQLAARARGGVRDPRSNRALCVIWWARGKG